MFFKKIISLSIAAILGITLFFSTGNAQSIDSKRISGDSRYDTSIKVSSAFDKSDYMVLASGQGYADALFGSTLSSQINSPLLLTEKNKLSNGVSNEIKRLSVKEVFILGGENTISKNVEKELSALGIKVSRLTGKDRLETAQAIANKRISLSNKKSVIKSGTDGYNFPDALVAGVFVGKYNKDNKIATLLPDISNNNFEWYFGGKGNANKKFAGNDRYETAISVANSYKSILGINPDTIVLVNGENYPDALSASALSAKYNAPILLTPSKSVSPATQKFIKDNGIKKIIVVGGQNSVNQSVLDAYMGKVAPIPKPARNTFEEATVTRVVDGDTIEVNLAGKNYKLRLVGVDTPETVHPSKPVEFYGLEASNYTKSQLTGKKIYLQKDVSETDKYGRLLRYVWLTRPSSNEPTKEEVINQMFNAQLVKNGYAHAYSYPPDVKHIPIFRELEKNAMNSSLGLWNKDLESKFTSDSNQTTISSETVVDKTHGIVRGNINSKIYHMHGDKWYDKMNEENIEYFKSEAEAIAAGYRRSKI